MNRTSCSKPPRWRKAILSAAAAIGSTFLLASPASAANSWSSWWLPPNHSIHGKNVDTLFYWIFWITMVAWVLVQVTMIVFLIKYRHNPNKKKGTFIHGNTRLEMIWTLVPAVILALIAFFSKQVWTEYRFASEFRPADANVAKVMVIGEQFKWNILYPGPDGKFGKYLLYPKVTDAKWPDGKKNSGVDGPRDLPRDRAQQEINKYINSVNPLGKDFSDPNGKDDIFEGALGRVMEIPLGRPVDVYVSAKDVIHSFSLPNFRVKLDTVPGMIGVVSFTPVGEEIISKQREKANRVTRSLEDLEKVLADPATRDQRIFISEADTAQGAEKDATGWRFVAPDPKNKTKKVTIIRDGGGMLYDVANPSGGTIGKLRAVGVKTITTYQPGYFDLVCMELCGLGHYTMQGQVNVIDNEEYAAKYEGKKPAATQPAVAAAH